MRSAGGEQSLFYFSFARRTVNKNFSNFSNFSTDTCLFKRKIWPGRLSSRVLALLVLALTTPAAFAVTTQFYRDDGYDIFSKGDLESAALTSDGFLLPTYDRKPIGNTGTEIVWDVVRDTSSSVICATGHQGRLIRLRDDQTSETITDCNEPELTALVRMGDGSTLVAAAPSAMIYRMEAGDKFTTYTQLSNARFVWRMVADKDGSVLAATGPEGRLFRIRPRATGADVEEVYDFPSANLLDLWIDQEGRVGQAGDIYIGGQNPGYLYRFRPADRRMEVVYNSEAEEVRALLPVEGGLALALNTERSPTAQALNLTLRMAGTSVSPPPMAPPQESQPPGGPPTQQNSPANMQDLGSAFSPAQQTNYGAARSEIILLNRAGFTRRVWTAPSRPIHSLAPAPGGGIFAAAGDQGRLYEVQLGGEYAIVADLRDDFIVRLVPDENGRLLVTARNGSAIFMSNRRAARTTYAAKPMDGRTPVKWGEFYFRGNMAQGQRALVEFRTGNTPDPGANLWSEWSKPEPIANNQPVSVPGEPRRYLQYRVTLEQDGGNSTTLNLDSVEVFFRDANVAPYISGISFGDRRPAQPPTKPGDSGASGSGGGTPPPTGTPAPAPPDPTPPPPRPERTGSLLNIQWNAQDPNNDSIRYTLYFRGEGETEWKLVEEKLTVNRMSLNMGGVADGRYRFRLVASDEMSNPLGVGLTDEKLSDEVVFDNSRPLVNAPQATPAGRRATIRLAAEDQLTLIGSAKVDLDNGEPYPLFPTDGLLDQQREQFEWITPELTPGEHVATFNIADRYGNTSVAKVVFIIQQ